MSINVDFYTFSKKENSTAQPNPAYKTTYACVLKDSCGILNPSITLNLGTSGNPASFNYAYISDFQRYYFVDEWTFEQGTWTASMHVDTLATYKTGIGLSTQYVLRAADNSAWNGNIIDGYYTTKGGASITEKVSSGLLDGDAYIVGVYGGDGNSIATGPITWYVMDQTNMTKFSKFLYSTDMYGLTAGVVDKALFNPLEYIASAFWIPVAAPTSGTALSVIFGWYTGPIGTGEAPAFTASRLSTPTGGPYSITIDVPKHPQAATRGNYLNLAPYSRYTLYAGPFGIIPLDSNELYNLSSITLEITSMDFTTGYARFQVKTGLKTLYNTTEQLAVPMPLAQLASNLAGYAVTRAANQGPIADLAINVALAAADIVGAADSLLPQQSTTGSVGTKANIYNPFLSAEFINITDENDDHAGRPVCSEKQINTLSGFIMCADGELSIAATSSELTSVRNYLTGGFFYE